MAHVNLTSSLFDVPPLIMETFCDLMDCSDGELGWRGLAQRLSPDWIDFRKIEKYADQGKSRTKELLWSWAHKNKTVGDLLNVLKEMGHQRAVLLFKEINVLPRISLQVIKEQTNHFDTNLLIGEGHFFDVYEADIEKKRCVVKLLKQKNKSEDYQRQVKLFMSQWQHLPRVQHPNLLELLGYVAADDSVCLVYPYLENGSLFHRLHCGEKMSPLSWQMRYNILLGVAQAIHYLHTMSPCPMICGNITSKNILLDQHFQPKLSDFAMVHLRSYLINHIKTIKMDHATLRLLGYLPEEYIRRGDLSVKTDVYSYGIIIMEVLSGCQAVLNGPNTKFLRDVFWEEIETNRFELLLKFKDMKTSGWPCCVAENLLRVSIDNTAPRARQRPTMDEVLKRIENGNLSERLTKDHPMPLMSFPPQAWPLTWSHSNVPVETDETLDDSYNMTEIKKEKGTPCECSQSQVTFLSNTNKYQAVEKKSSGLQSPLQADHILQMPDPSYTSRPVECSCLSGTSSTSFCEDCKANGFGQI